MAFPSSFKRGLCLVFALSMSLWDDDDFLVESVWRRRAADLWIDSCARFADEK